MRIAIIYGVEEVINHTKKSMLYAKGKIRSERAGIIFTDRSI